METADSQNQSAESILHALSMAGSDAWCFAPIDQDDLTFCSRSFIQAWGFDLNMPERPGCSISLRDSRIGDRLESMGLERNWLSTALKSSEKMTHMQSDPAVVGEVRRVVLSDTDGRPAGVLLICRKPHRHGVSEDVYARAVESQRRLSGLSPRESEILELVFDGFTNKAVAAKANISEKTVEKHRSNIMRKMGVRSLATLIRSVTEAQLVGGNERPTKNSVECG
jgi:DNA-binding CsgD family transcriptional regulator